MNLAKRISNLWKLSEFEPKNLGDIPIKETKRAVTILSSSLSQKAQIISYKPRDPVKKITEQDPNAN